MYTVGVCFQLMVFQGEILVALHGIIINLTIITSVTISMRGRSAPKQSLLLAVPTDAAFTRPGTSSC